MNIASLSIKRPVLIVMIVMLVITLGVLGYVNLPVDLIPNVEFPNIMVLTTYQGASAEEIESLITKPLENSLGTVEGLDTLMSVSHEGSSFVMVTFKMGVDIKFAELKVREKVQQAAALFPQDVKDPQIRRFSTEDIPIMYLSIQGNRDLSQLREILENDIQPKLEIIEGVGSIDIMGARKKIVKIALNDSLLAANGISYSQIVAAINNRNVSFPVGAIKTKGKVIAVRIYGKSENVQDFGNIHLTTSTGKVLRIKDIADVQMTLEEEQTRARVNQTNAVLFSIYKQSGGNTVKVSDMVRNSLPEIQKLLPGDMSIHIVNDTAEPIKRSIRGVQEDILLGALLAILIVWLFLGNFRSTIITAVALPNSLLGAFFLVNAAGFSLNTITLLSLSLSVGLLIDDSIVVRENIFRYIEHGLNPKEAAEKGTNEVALAVLSTTLSIMAVFIPISFLSGVIGQFFREFGMTVAFALLISLIDAFTTAPMLSAYWFKQTAKGKKGFGGIFNRLSEKWNDVYSVINNVYRKTLEWGLKHKKIVILSTIGLFVFSIIASSFIGKGFMSGTDSGMMSVSIETFPGAPMDIIDGYSKKIEEYALKQKDIESVYTLVGRDGSYSAMINISMKKIGERKTSTQDMIKNIRMYIMKNFEKNIKYRLSETGGPFGGGALGGGYGGSAIMINVYGPDLKQLEVVSRKVMNLVTETPGASDVNTTFRPGSPEIVIRMDDIKAERLGITALSLGYMLRDMVQGAIISTYSKNDRDYYVYIQMKEEDRSNIRDIKNLYVTSKTGKKVPLSAICTLTYSSSPLEIRRENKQRVIRVGANVEKGFSLNNVVDSVKKKLDKEMLFPQGYSYAFTGQQKQFVDLVKQMGFAMILAVIFMYMILAALYNSFVQPLILMISIPLAIIGAFLGLLITGVDLDIYGYIGLLLVLGLVAKNAILLIDFTNKNRENGMSIREALLHAGPIRLRPILMTSFAMIFGMLPLALGLNEGSRGRQSMPVTVISGILTSTFLTLIVVPVIYEWVEGLFERRKKIKKDKRLRTG